MLFLCRLVAALPLAAVQSLGALLARIAFACAGGERRRLDENLRRAGYFDPAMRRAVIEESGKTLLELPWIWLRPQEEVVKLVREVVNPELFLQAKERGKGIVFLTPHLGCFEASAQFAALHSPITVMYRPPRQRVLEPLLRAGRARGNIRIATADRKGVFTLLRALRNGETVGILPDQVPSRGEGEWADFFGRPAYTMALASRLVDATGAVVILALCERLPRAAGYRIHLTTLPEREPGESAARHLNRALEGLIRQKPEQYLWSYNRYKVPPGVAPPAASTTPAGTDGGGA
ncbi:MAG: lysophospholipid acyltransferase family protein [Betaproteobacteria bacterium]|jgi:KDO2-lipid IV(A) lauroyltransferase|nr:lysophospholipid acyltransferase family protein [Betaproteobacteria bacterium]